MVSDENGLALPAVQLVLEKPGAAVTWRCETDFRGACRFAGLAAGAYRLRATKEGFYASEIPALDPAKSGVIEIALAHVQEFREVVEVTDSPPTIDPAQTASSEQLTSREIFSVPYSGTRDFRNVLPYLPGVVQDARGQIHLGGSATYQVQDQLDGFNVTEPATGLLQMRVSTDALRVIDAQRSRYSADSGKASGGILRLETAMGDDRYRFTATNFVPGVEVKKGVRPGTWSPRATFSGPLRRGKAWFLEAADGEYDYNFHADLPAGADRNPAWRVGSLSKTQVNLTPGNILSASFLLNRGLSEGVGLSRLTPPESTTEQSSSAYLLAVKDSAYLGPQTLLEAGFAWLDFTGEELPQGLLLPYVLRPSGASGKFFRSASATSQRLQWIANLYLPPAQWGGRHEFKLGLDFDRIFYHQVSQRRQISVVRQDGTLFRQIGFTPLAYFRRPNLELGGYLQDRWSLNERLLLELGARADWDEIVRAANVSPRLAGSFLPRRDGKTKLTLGAGLFYDATSLNLMTRPLLGQRSDTFFAADGRTPLAAPLPTSFAVDRSRLEAPRFLNWSAGWEQKLPAEVYVRVGFLQKFANNGFTFMRHDLGPGQLQFLLANSEHNRYHDFELTARRRFHGNYEVLASYIRSSARSNAVLIQNFDDPIFSQQASGPLAWDVPNRFLSWGWMPAFKRLDFAYAVEWRNGFPFSVVNQGQQLVGPPNSRRFPDYFTLNMHLERRFGFRGRQWALRAGFNNITGRANPTVVNNNIDAPDFLKFSGRQARAFTGRIRLLGRK